MSEAQDIRAWAKAAGIDIGDRGRIPDTVRTAFDVAQATGAASIDSDGDAELAGPPVLIDLNGTAPPAPVAAAGSAPAAAVHVTPPAPAAAAGPAERPPTPPPPGKRKPGGLFGKREPKPRGPRPAHKRVSIENVVATGWGLGAMALARSPRALPMARVLDMQAPVAGLVVEDMAKGTLLDKVLQPIARGGESAEKIMALVGPPLIVGMITAQPAWFPVLRPMLKMAMMSWVQIAGPAMTKLEKRQAEFNERFGVDDAQLDALIDSFWAQMPAPGPVSEQEEEHVRRARGESA